MAAVVNTSVPAAALSTPARNSSPPWSQVVRGVEGEVLVNSASQLIENAVVEEEEQSKEGAESGSKKPVWNKPSNVAPESGPIMGAAAWPTLSESTKAPPKPPLSDSLTNPSDSPASSPQVAATTVDSSPAMTSNPNSPNPSATQSLGRQRSMRREGVGNSSSNGRLSHQPPQFNSVREGSVDSNVSTNTGNGVSDSSRRDHGHNYANRDGVGQRNNPSQRNYRRSNSGPVGRRDANPEWIHQRSFNGRGPVMPQQRGGPRAFVRPPPPGVAPYIPPPIQPYRHPIGITPGGMRPPYYFTPPQPGMPFFAPLPRAVYFPPTDPPLPVKIINQIDYYFSIENLVKDTYLRQNMDEQGWVPIQLIARFNKVKQLSTNIKFILDSLRGSTVVEIQGDKVRKRADWRRWIMPPSVHFPATSGSQSPPIPGGGAVAACSGALSRSSSGDVNVEGEASKDGSSSSGH